MDPFDLRKWSGFQKTGKDLSEPLMIDHITIDSRRVYGKYTLFVPLKGDNTDGHNFLANAKASGAKYALVKKSFLNQCPKSGLICLPVEDTLQSLQQIVGAYRKELPCQLIAITGSYGKTMAKDLLLDMAKRSKVTCASPESFNSQIGAALSLLAISKKDQLAIIEAGISKIGEMDRLEEMISPTDVVITRLGKKHQETLFSIENTAKEMIKLTQNLSKKSWVLLPDTPSFPLLETAAKCLFWNQKTPKLPHALKIAKENLPTQKYCVNFPNGYLFEGSIAKRNYYILDLINICLKAAWLIDCPLEDIQEVLTSYIPQPMRTEIWQSPLGATFINEPYCSDPLSVDAALKRFHGHSKEGKKTFIFGGLREARHHREKDYERVASTIIQSKVDELLLIGSDEFSPLVNQVKIHASWIKTAVYPCFETAFEYLKTKIREKDTILIKGKNKTDLDYISEQLHGSVYTNQCFINLSAIEANLKVIRKKGPQAMRLMPILKASAYGTDHLIISKFLASNGIDIFGVSYVDEGAALKRGGIKQSVFAINAALFEAKKVVDWDLEVGVSSQDLAAALAKESQKQQKITKVHLHLDTGMSRLGCRKEEALELAEAIVKNPYLKLEGIMTHFAAADSPSEDAFTRMQAKHFDQVIETIEKELTEIPWKHAANSSALFRFHFPQYNMARIGLALYGLSPSPAASSADLRLALSLQSKIVGINHCKKGESVGYGRDYLIEKECQKVAIVPIGYFEGLHRHYSGKGSIMIHGKTAPMIGKICMDFLMADITEIPTASIGDPVLIFGENEEGFYLSPESLATSGNSIPHELITCLGPRIQRIFIHEESPQSTY